MFKGVVSRDEIAPLTLHMTSRKWLSIPTELVRISDLFATQEGVHLAPLIRPSGPPVGGDEYPHVVYWNGESFLEDGHHRILRALLNGEYLIEARVLVV